MTLKRMFSKEKTTNDRCNQKVYFKFPSNCRLELETKSFTSHPFDTGFINPKSQTGFYSLFLAL